MGEPAGNTGEKPSVLLVDDARFSLHAPRGYHPERPERLTAARAAVAKAEVSWVRVPAREATSDELARVHTAKFIDKLETLRGDDGYLDPDTYIAKESVNVARIAAGGVIAMVDAMIDGPSKRGVALVRPPGHHARPSQAMGFCLLNNVAIAAAHAKSRGIERIAIVDWDVHHGNGTQEAFFADPNVLYVSLHQFPFYPGTGAVDERGEAAGAGFTVNVPLAAGGGDAVYRGAFERVVLPVLEEYAPELILVSAGFDASARDPLAEMTLSAEAFGWMARALGQAADAHAGGRVGLVLEGGYDLVALESGLIQAVHGIAAGQARDIPREVDDEDLERAVLSASESWSGVE